MSFFKRRNLSSPESCKTKLSGDEAESVAKDYLIARGLTYQTNNFAMQRGEIDLVMYDNNTLVFVEVRFRSNLKFGNPEESVTPQKCQRLTAAANFYLQVKGIHDSVASRFDLVAISPDATQTPPYQINWIKNFLQ